MATVQVPEEDKGLGGRGSEIYLETLGACFLCLKVPSSSGGDSESGFSEVCLGDVYRYLEVSGLKKKRQEGAAGGEGNRGGGFRKREEYNFEVTLCDECSTETKHLSELIHSLETVQTGIASRLKNIHGILKGSKTEEGVQQLERIQKDSPMQACLLEHMRAETDKKCFEKLTTLPQAKEMASFSVPESVATPPASSGQVFMPPPSSSRSLGAISISLEPTDSTGSLSLNVQRIMPYSAPSASPNEQDSPSESTSVVRPQPQQNIRKSSKDGSLQIFPSHFATKLQNGVKMINCLHCNVNCRKTTNIRMHLVTKHVEVLFSKIPGVPRKLFGEKVLEVLMSETKRNGDSGKPSNDGEKLWQCKICKRGFLHGKGCRYHLIVEHYAVLVKKLRMLLECAPTKGESSRRTLNSVVKEEEGTLVGGGSEESNQGSVAGTPRRGKYKCTVWSGGCGLTFSKLETLQMHQNACRKKRRGEVSTCSLEDGVVGKQASSKNALKLQPTQCPKTWMTAKTELRRSGRNTCVGDGHQDQMSKPSDGNLVENVEFFCVDETDGSKVTSGGIHFDETESSAVNVEMEEFESIDVEGGLEDGDGKVMVVG